MYKMMTYRWPAMELVDVREFERLEMAEAFAEFCNFGQLVLIIDTRTGKCVHRIER